MKWTQDDINKLESLLKSDISVKNISLIMNRSEISIQKKSHRIGYDLNKRLNKKLWSDIEEVKLEKLYLSKIEISKISELMNRSKSSIIKKINRLEIKKIPNRVNVVKKRDLINWSDVQSFHDQGNTYDDIRIEFKLSPQDMKWARVNNKLSFRTQKEGILLGISKRMSKIDYSIYKNYKKLCSFKFYVFDFINESDFNLIKRHGWYKSTNNGNNPNGVSRDHKISIKYGFDNNIDPKIISHPANCQIITQNENSRKNSKNSTSIAQLNEDIIKWNIKYGN